MTVFFDTPVDKSLGVTGTWTDIDLSLNVPAGATGAIFQIINTVVDNPQKFGLRKKGSTDNRYKGIGGDAGTFALIGIDANRKCQGKIDVTDIDFYLVGYTLEDAAFFTNAYDKSQSTTGTWTDLDLSAEVPAGTVAVIFEIVNTGTSAKSWGMRKKGSTDNRYGELAEGCHLFFVIGVDGNRECEFKIESWLVDFYLLGYLTAGVAETNGIDRSLGSTGSYIDITETNAPNNATGAYGQLYTSQVWQSYAARKNGSSWDKYKVTPAENGLILVGLDGDKKWEGKISNTSVDFYTLGYFSLGRIEKFSSDVGVGTDAISECFVRIEKFSSDVGVGTDAISECSAEVVQTDQGLGVESLGSRLLGSMDDCVGHDGIFDRAIVSFLLKLLQKRRMSIALSQMGLAGGRGGNGVMDYGFRKKCTVVATVAGAQTNYQMELIVGESSGAVGAGVHCNAHCQDFPDDIRFIKEDGLTKHDYWIDLSSLEGTTPNRKVDVLIEVASIPASGSVDFYMYYGMSGDSGESNIANTFLNSDEYKRPDTSGAYFEDFLDDYNEESHSNIAYSVHKPTKYATNPVFSGGTWDEDKYYVHVDFIDSIYKMWYGAVDASANLHCCYAESNDGYSWTRPVLNLISYGGNTNNNILLPEDVYAPSIYHDPNASDPDRKYILQSPGERGKPAGSNQHIYFSPDGKDFTFGKVIYGPNPENTGHMEADAIQKLEDGSGRWISYHQRYHSGSMLRAIGAQVSDTDDPMGDWTNFGVLIPEIDANDQNYSLGCTYKDGRYYAFIPRYNKSTERTEISFWISRNGLTWHEKDTLWLPRGGAGTWDESMLFDGETLVKVGDEWWFFYTGSKYNHAHSLPRQSHVGIAKIDYRRIGSIRAVAASYEDFTTFTEVDVAADRIQKTAQHVDHLAYRNETTYLYKDYGAAHFGDFTHKIKIQLAGGGDTYNTNIVWGLANILNNSYAIETGGDTQIILYAAEAAGSVFKIYIKESYLGTGYYDTNVGGFNIGDWVYAKMVKSGTSLNAYLYSDSGYTTLVGTLSLTLHADHTFRYLYACNTWNTGATYKANTNIDNFDLGGGGAGVEGTFISKNFFTLNSLKLNADASGGGTLKLELLDVNSNPVTGYTKADFDTISTNGYEFVPAWGGETGLPSQPVKLKFYLESAHLYSYLADCSTISYSDPIDDLGGDWIENPDNSSISNELLSLTEGGLNDEWYQRKVRQIQNENIDYKIEARLKTSVTNSTGYLFCMGGGNKQWSIFFNIDGKIYYVHSGGTVDCGVYNVDTWYIFSIVHKTTGVVDYYINGDLKASDQAGLVHSSWRIVPREFGFGTSFSNTCILNVDWVIVRKYSSPEPTWGVWGNEEERGIVFFQLKLLQEKVLNMKLSQIGMIL